MKKIIYLLLFLSSPVFAQLSINSDISILQAQSDEGNPEAKFFLGALYYSGSGVDQSFEKAIELFQEASKAGWVSATYNLGVIYHNLGVDLILNEIEFVEDIELLILFQEKNVLAGLA